MCIECDEIDEGKRSFLKGATAAFLGVALNAPGFGQQATSAVTPRALDNPNIIHQPVTFKNGADTIKGYLARPKKEGRYRAVIVTN